MNALEAAELRVKLNEWRSLLKLHATLREAIRVDGLSRWRSTVHSLELPLQHHQRFDPHRLMKSSRRQPTKPAPEAPDLNLRDIRERAAVEETPIRDALEVLQLYQRNLDEIFRWFRNSSTPGRERGHIVLGEIFFGLANEAMTCALEGKSWSPGNRQP